MKDYRLAYINTYQDDQTSYGKCEDCEMFGLLVKEAACGDYHDSSYMCCHKWVCEYGCCATCPNCGTNNRIEMVEGYVKAYDCYKCHERTELRPTWWGNSPMESCRRYCGCALQNWNGIVKGDAYERPNDHVSRKENVIRQLNLKNSLKNVEIKITSSGIQVTLHIDKTI